MKKLLQNFYLLFCFAFCMHSNAQSGKILSLDGTNSYMSVVDHADLDVAPGETKTITCWIKTTSTATARIIAKRTNLNASNPATTGITGTGYEMWMGNGTNAGKVAGNAGAWNTASSAPQAFSTAGYNPVASNDGVWHHLAAVFDNSSTNKTVTFYVDAANPNSKVGTFSGTYDFSTGVAFIVGAATNSSNFFTGLVDNVQIWNKALSMADLATEMTTGTPPATTGATLLAGWDFENVSGTAVPDISGRNHPGTLNGNASIITETTNMQINTVSLIQTQLPTGMGDTNQRIVAVKVSANGIVNPLTVNKLNFTMNGTTDLSDVTNIKVYSSGATAIFDAGTATLFGSVTPAAGNLVANGSKALVSGDNYFWITYDVAATATEGNVLDATCESIEANTTTYTTTANTVAGNRVILLANTLLFTPGDAGSASYRIPALITAADGSLVTVTDKRWNGTGDLAAKIDPVVRRSTDNGKTWSTPVVIANFGAATGAGDAAIVMDKTNGNLICILAANKGFFASTNANPIQILIVRSTDNGVTWGTPVDITSQIYGPNPNWKGIFIAAGRAHQLRDGKIVAALTVREDVSGSEKINNYMMSSVDSGVTWTASTGRAELDGDEAKIVELNNGNLMMSIRNSGTRRFNISTDKGVTWGTAYNQAAITDPNCNGDFIRYTSTIDGYDKNRLLHSVPFATNRSNVSVLMSTDEGTTWPTKKTIFSGASAYSSLTVLPDGTLGMYYENGESSTYQMYFVRFSLNWLTDGADTFVASTLGVQSNVLIKKDLKLNVVVSPNPTTDLLNIKVNNANTPVTIKLYNLSGKMIYETSISNTSQETIFSLRNQAQGIYILKVNDANTTISSKIIKK